MTKNLPDEPVGLGRNPLFGSEVDEMKKKTACLALYLIASVLTLSVAAQEEDLTGTWVGSLKGIYNLAYAHAIPDNVTIGFTMQLTIKVTYRLFNKVSFDGKEKIVIDSISWTESEPSVLVKNYSLTPMQDEVAISGLFDVENKTFNCMPETGVILYHLKMEWSLLDSEGKEQPMPPNDFTDYGFGSGLSGFFLDPASYERQGNTITIRFSESTSEPDGGVTCQISGTLVLQAAETVVSETPTTTTLMETSTTSVSSMATVKSETLSSTVLSVTSPATPQSTTATAIVVVTTPPVTTPAVTTPLGPAFEVSTSTIAIIIVVIIAVAALAVAALRLSKKNQVERGKTGD